MDTEAIRQQTARVDAFIRRIADTQTLINKVSARNCGQELASITINGVKFELTLLNSAYLPELRKGMETIQRECLAILQAQLESQRSALEGAEWKLRQLLRA